MYVTDHSIIRSRRRTIAVEITEDAAVLVRAPYRTPLYEINDFLEKNADWIEKNIRKVIERKNKAAAVAPLTREDVVNIANEALSVIPKKVAYYAQILGVTYGHITIRNQKTLWGSCSTKGDLNFNCILMKAPENVQNYVIIHELCHRLEMNHSRAFWRHVEELCPDHKQCRKWLKEEGSIWMTALAGVR